MLFKFLYANMVHGLVSTERYEMYKTLACSPCSSCLNFLRCVEFTDWLATQISLLNILKLSGPIYVI